MMRERSSHFDDSFVQHYQPIVCMRTLSLAGYEALLRPICGASPQSLVEAMERSREIVLLDAWSLEAAIKKASAQAGSQKIMVNISAISLCDPLFFNAASELLSCKPAHANIGFEITETRAIVSRGSATRFIEMARSSGCSVGIDDVGAGHAGIDIAIALKLDFIKLSENITTKVLTSIEARQFIRNAVHNANEAGMRVVAEHIDNINQCELLRKIGVCFGQGWLFAKASEIVEQSKDFSSCISSGQKSHCVA